MTLVLPGLGPRWNYAAETFTPRGQRWMRRGLVAAWLCDEAAGLALGDVGGGGAKGTLTGAGVTWTRGTVAGAALDFSGTSSKVVIARSPRVLKPVAGLTVIVLCRPTQYGASKVPTLVDFGARNPASGGSGPWCFLLDNLTVANGISIRINTAASVFADAKFAGAVTLGVWQILAVTYIKLATFTNRFQGYRDGRPVGNAANLSHIPSKALTADPVIGEGIGVYFGQVGGCWIYDYGMNAGQMARACADLFGAWRFDPTALARPGDSTPPAPEGGGIPAIYRRRRGGL